MFALVAVARQDRKGGSEGTAPPDPIHATTNAITGPHRLPAEVTQPTILSAPPDFVDPRTIKVGDVIDCQGVRYRAIGALYLTRKGSQWVEYLMDDGKRGYRWLSVEERPGLVSTDPSYLEVLVWTPVPTQGMVPAKHTLLVEGVEYFPVERGTAAFRSDGTTGHPERGLLDFADYQAEDGRSLSFQRVQGEMWRSAYATPVSPGSLRIHPRS
ncbi:DUF4178 domain-containing protein [Rhizohabitans arisaemae]|uniref:DUF4178 domain-containing protein n=1 Tax=Rhizohabitans arisaemae TaxID=2720610 RepID=UPI0024B12888|nr:DUF4178 domain-containing protein [Rhizohabitans arisaemae]